MSLRRICLSHIVRSRRRWWRNFCLDIFCLVTSLYLLSVCPSAPNLLLSTSPPGLWMALSTSTVDPPDPPIVPYPSAKIWPTYIRTSSRLALFVGKLNHMPIRFNIFLLIYHNLKHRYVYAQWISRWTAFYYNFDDDGLFWTRLGSAERLLCGWLDGRYYNHNRARKLKARYILCSINLIFNLYVIGALWVRNTMITCKQTDGESVRHPRSIAEKSNGPVILLL